MNTKLQDIREEIELLADEKYREFQSRLLPDVKDFVGVRLPQLRKMAKRIAKQDGEGYLNRTLCQKPEEELYEEIMLQGMVIGYIDKSISDILSFAERFIPKIDNWSVCDSFCSGLKCAAKYPQETWEWLQKYVHSDTEFDIRFGVVMLLNYYINEHNIRDLFSIFDEINHDGYYVKMAVAWAVSICYVKYPEDTMEYLKKNRLDDFTYNKALQKIVESHSVKEEEKGIIKKMKREGHVY